jgi:hypothetical protein
MTVSVILLYLILPNAPLFYFRHNLQFIAVKDKLRLLA